jgi:hypothetical protein
MLLILAYALLQVTYSLVLITKQGYMPEQFVVAIEQFLMLLVVWRTLFYQYYKTAFNIN